MVGQQSPVAPHQKTSWWAVGLILLTAVSVLGIFTSQAIAQQITQSGSISVAGVVPSPPPSVAAVILQPKTGERFLSSPIVVSGTCPADVVVAIYRNNVFAGSTPCRADETFILEINLTLGQNVLIARVYDALDQAGPDSKPVIVYLDTTTPVEPPKPGVKPTTKTPQLILVVDPVYRGTFPDSERQIRPEVYGGKAPYALSFEWGDNKSELLPRAEAGKFGISHSWEHPGEYGVKIRARDTEYRSAYVQTTVIINGPTPPKFLARVGGVDLRTLLLSIWPLLASTILITAAFYLGERHQLDKLTPKLKLKPQHP